jgi:hypothetical protein
MDVFLHVTRDGGATFDVLGTGGEKHSDNHALVIDREDPNHLIVGTDASVYESFDEGTTWRQFPNLPVSQFYKLALDTAEPFYNIVGGAQDLGTLLGPSRTNNVEGIRNRDWYVPLGADGYACAFDLEEPDLVYMQTQGGELQRYDRRSHEFIGIKPVPAPGEPPERWNWDSPIIVSPHSHTRLYFGSQRLWRSDDRGNSWKSSSGGLTRDRNRYELEMMGRVWSVDALYDNGAMSLYGTITTISESSLVEGLLYVGTDDGLIQVSEDGGDNWRTVEEFPGVPELSFVNDIQASLHDPDTVFAVLDAHKTGDFHPFLFESKDRGRTWRSIAGNLPSGEIVWAMEQDHVEPDLLFVGAELGLYFSPDRGFPPSPSATSSCSVETTIWSAPPSAAVSTFWTTTHLCVRSRRVRSSRKRPSFRCGMPGGSYPTSPCRRVGSRRWEVTTSPLRIHRSEPSSPTT